MGHGTHKGIIAGLLGYKPDNLNLDLLNREILNINKKSQISLAIIDSNIPFDIKKILSFQKKPGMILITLIQLSLLQKIMMVVS